MKQLPLFIVMGFLAASVIWAEGDESESPAPPVQNPYSAFGSAKAKLVYGNSESSFDENTDALTYQAIIEAHHRFELGPINARIDHDVDLSDSSIELSIYEAYVSFKASDWLDFSLGKKRMNLGSGNLLNPSDTIHPLEPVGAQKSGFRGLTTRLSLGQEFGLNFAYGIDRVLDNTSSTDLGLASYAASFDGQIDSLNLGLAYLYSKTYTNEALLWLGYDFGGLVASLEASLEFDPQQRRLSGNPSSPSIDDTLSPSFKSVVELRYVGSLFENDLTISLDYLFNQGGWTLDETNLYIDTMTQASLPVRAAVGPIIPKYFRNQHYLASSIQWSKSEDYGFSLANTINLTDASGKLSLGFSKNLSPELIADLGATFFMGDANDEYGAGIMKANNVTTKTRYSLSCGLNLSF